MKNRRAAVNIRKMFDLITYAEQNDLEALILSLDFEKCFDKISFKAIFGSLHFFYFD